MSTSIRPFTVSIPDEQITDLRERLARTRWPAPLSEGWEYGTPVRYLRELCDYWRENYDWRRWEERLNAFPHFVAGYDGIDLHFIHRPSPHADARPLLMIHGWPGSVFEFHKIIDVLAEPERHGGRKEDAFHVVCPSIPGFGFSSAPQSPGFETRAASRLFFRLMSDLGYERFFVQGGDLGAGIALKMARLGQERIVAAHLNMALLFAPKQDPMRNVTEEERKRLDESQDPDGVGYAAIQSTKPQSLGYGLTDSPAGLAGWIVEKFHAWTDHNGDLERAVSRDELLTNISIYWFTATATSSARYYYETAHYDEASANDPQTVPAPISFALFPADLMQPPREWARRKFNLARWTRMPRGGHFAALEEPELLANDIWESFRDSSE
ncbi:MAG: epoxide hydrolase family protein [Spirochaetales bacterium]